MAADRDQSAYSEEDALVQRERLDDTGPVLLNDVRKESPAKLLGICYICCLSLALAPGIVAIIIAASTNFGTCDLRHTNYLVSLDVWLYIAGSTSIVEILVYLYLNAYLTFFASLEMYMRIVQLGFSRGHFIIQVILTVLHTAWGIIGIYMYAAQMTTQCWSSNIGTMVLIFAILELFLCCCVSCVMMIVVANDDRSQINAVGGIGLNFYRYQDRNGDQLMSPDDKS